MVSGPRNYPADTCSLFSLFPLADEPSRCYFHDGDGVCEEFEQMTSIKDCGVYTPKGFLDQWASNVSVSHHSDQQCPGWVVIGQPAATQVRTARSFSFPGSPQGAMLSGGAHWSVFRGAVTPASSLWLHQGWPLAAASLFLSLISSDELKFSASHPTGAGWSCGWVDSMGCAGVTSPNHHHLRDRRAPHSKHREWACGNEFWRLMPNNTKECSFFFNSFVFSASQFHKSTLLFYSEKGPVHSQSHSLDLTPFSYVSFVT